jgi:hypothetical protein
MLSVTASGHVYDLDTKEPLQAHIYLLSAESIHICDSMGSFAIPDIIPGKHTILFSHIGFKNKTLHATIVDIDTNYLRIGLQTEPITVDEIEATGTRIIASGKQSFAREEIEIIPGAERDVFRAIQIIPGVSSASDYLGLFYVRGGELYENKVLLDNVEILSPYHYFGVGSTFNIDLIKGFDLYMGTMPVRYGDAVSSVLLLHSTETNGRRSGALSADLIEAGLCYNHPLSQNSALVLSAKRNYLDVLLKRLGIVEGVLLPYFFDLQARMNIATKYGNFTFNGLRSKEGTDIQASFADETVQLKMNGLGNNVWFEWNVEATDKVDCQTYISYSDMDRYVHGEIPTSTSSSETAIEEYNVVKYGTSFHTQYSSEHAGFALGGGIGRYGLTHTGPRVEDIFYKIGAISHSLEADTSDGYAFLYAAQHFSIFGVFNCELGERIDWLPTIGQPTFSPRIKLVYKRKPNFFFAYGYLYQTPPLEYSTQIHKPLRAKTLNIGVEHLLLPGLLGKIEFYNKQYTNLIRGYQAEFFFNDGKGTASGIEVSLRKYRFGNSFGMISYAYSFSKRTTPYDSAAVITDVHRPHIFNFYLGSRLPAGFELGVKLQASSGLAYRPVIGREGQDMWQPVYALEKGRLPYYQRIDLHLEKEFLIWGMQSKVYVTVMNITNHQNVQGYLYNGDYTTRKAIYMLPRIPLVGFSMTF